MHRLIILLAFLTLACGGRATQKDDLGGGDPNPDVAGFVETEEKVLLTTPYMTKWQLNEVYADTTDFRGVLGRFTFTPLQRTELTVAFEEIQVTECSEPGASRPSYVLIRADGSREGIHKDQPYTVEAQESVKLQVSFPNLSKCHGIDVLFGVHARTL